MYYTCKSSAMLILGVLALVASQVDSMSEVRIGNDTISFVHRWRHPDQSRTNKNQEIGAISTSVCGFLQAILSPDFTGTRVAIKRESNYLKVEAMDRIKELMLKSSVKEQKQLESVINLIKDNIYSDTANKSTGKLSADEIIQQVQLLEKFFTEKYEDNWLVDIKSIEVNELKLEEIVGIYSGLFEKNGLGWVRRLFFEKLNGIALNYGTSQSIDELYQSETLAKQIKEFKLMRSVLE